MDRKLQSLEMLRALAAILVVLYHTDTIFSTRVGIIPFAGIFASGFRGVDLFFVLSGFIIAHVHASDIGHPHRLGNYLFNRMARIYPAVWIMTMFAGSLYATGFGGTEKAAKLAMASVAASALLLPQVGGALVNVTWTLKYEIFFYLVFAVLIINLRAGLAALAVWQFVTLVASVSLSPEALGFSGFYLRSLCLDFGIGLICAWLLHNSDFVTGMRALTRQWALLAVGIVTFAGGMIAETHTSLAGIPCALGAGAVIVSLILLEQSGRIRVPHILLLLGSASYAIYLVHFSAITLLAVALIHLHFVPMNDFIFLSVAIFGIAAGAAFDRLVDQPVQRLLRRRLKPSLLRMKWYPHFQSPKTLDVDIRTGATVRPPELQTRRRIGWSEGKN